MRAIYEHGCQFSLSFRKRTLPILRCKIIRLPVLQAQVFLLLEEDIVQLCDISASTLHCYGSNKGRVLSCNERKLHHWRLYTDQVGPLVDSQNCNCTAVCVLAASCT
jgi:hypothetical protein